MVSKVDAGTRPMAARPAMPIWLAPIKQPSKRPLSQVHVSRLTEQAVDENKSGHGPTRRFDGELAFSIRVHHRQVRGDARPLPGSQADLHHRLAQSRPERHKTGDAVAACQHERSLPMATGKACDAIELNSEWRRRNGAGCHHCSIDDGRRACARKPTDKQQRDMEALRRDRRCRHPQTSDDIPCDPPAARDHRRIRQCCKEHVVQRRVIVPKAELLAHWLIHSRKCSQSRDARLARHRRLTATSCAVLKPARRARASVILPTQARSSVDVNSRLRRALLPVVVSGCSP